MPKNDPRDADTESIVRSGIAMCILGFTLGLGLGYGFGPTMVLLPIVAGFVALVGHDYYIALIAPVCGAVTFVFGLKIAMIMRGPGTAIPIPIPIFGPVLIGVFELIVSIVLSFLAAVLGRTMCTVVEQDDGRCAECGYLLRGITSGRCPECGTAVRGERDEP